MLLEIDLGNTFVKWRARESGNIVARGVEVLSDWHLPDLNIKNVWVSSVAAEGDNKLLADKINSNYGLVTEFAAVTWSAGGVQCAYEDPAKLGVDRWLALLAAHHLVSGSVIVVDAGSAITVDLLAADGKHIGGYIMPGFRMMQTSLLGQTARVRFEIDEVDQTLGGRDTSSCVASGAGLLLEGLVAAISALRNRFDDDAHIIVTGGDAERLLGFMDGIKGVQHSRELVLDGLEYSKRVIR